MRTLNELYKLLYEHIKHKEDLSYGLCLEARFMASGLIIEIYEGFLLREHIEKHKPKNYYSYSKYGWPLIKEYTQHRKDFVLKMIEETK